MGPSHHTQYYVPTALGVRENLFELSSELWTPADRSTGVNTTIESLTADINFFSSKEYHELVLTGRVTYPEVSWDCTVRNLKNAIRERANSDNAQWLQYKGHWDGPEWVLVKVTRRVKTKMGVAFEKGEIALARKTPQEPDSANLSPATRAEINKPSWTVYSVRNRVDTKVSIRTCKEL
jgi:hypothetical protein